MITTSQHDMNKIPLLILTLLLVSCSSIIRTRDGAESVQLFFLEQSGSSRYTQSLETSCEFVGEVIGSEGHWYSYWFISNMLLLQGAINDLKNRVYAKGGNVVIVYRDLDFTTSVTLLGQAYKCSQVESKDKARF
jgi:hypothetical protein